MLLGSVNPDRSASWPPPGLTFDWWAAAWDNEGARTALWTSVKAGLAATAIALVLVLVLVLVLGTLIAFAVQRYAFFGREAVSFAGCCRSPCPGSSPASR